MCVECRLNSQNKYYNQNNKHNMAWSYNGATSVDTDPQCRGASGSALTQLISHCTRYCTINKHNMAWSYNGATSVDTDPQCRGASGSALTQLISHCTHYCIYYYLVIRLMMFPHVT